MKISVKHLLNFYDNKPSLVNLSSKLFQLGHEHSVNGDILDIDFTPNRGDCLSLIGLLRDLNVFYESDRNINLYEEDIPELDLNFKNEAQEECPNISFLNIKIGNNKIDKYKDYLEDYFDDLNINKVNFFTDVSNYIAYETGQPTHSYDFSKINKSSGISLSKTSSSSNFAALNGADLILKGQNLLFKNNNQYINLAGVMGGLSTCCDEKTSDVLVECAYFLPESIIGTALKYNLNTDASHKFERGVDPLCHNFVLRRFVQIVQDHTDIISISKANFSVSNFQQKYLDIDIKKISSILGTTISETFFTESLTKLGFIIEDKIQIPSYRSDILSQNDIAEEIGRVLGYDNIKSQKIDLPYNSITKKPSKESKVKEFLIDNGFYEVINAPFSGINDSNSIRVDNSLDANKNYLRTSLKESLIQNMLFNERRQKDSIKLFEISDVYLSSSKSKKLAIIASGRLGKNYKDFSKKINTKQVIDLLEPFFKKSLSNIEIIQRDSLDTKIKSQIVFLELNIDDLSDDIFAYQPSSKKPKKFVQYSPISEYPSSFRDFSFSIKDISNESSIPDFLNVILSLKNKIIKDIFIFDYFYNEKIKELKIGIRFIFQSNNKTLSINEIDVVIDDIINITKDFKYVNVPGLDTNDSNKK